ncbi:hypothetical protein [Paraburkholderia unamae]|uniref:Uncharacterized protein n=1 Tax=Paraburkholderia unamae TaxID=219649 RepID=A0ACC6RH16_9BURK
MKKFLAVIALAFVATAANAQSIDKVYTDYTADAQPNAVATSPAATTPSASSDCVGPADYCNVYFGS